MCNQTHILILVKKLIIKILNLKLVIFLKYEAISAKGYTPNWSVEVFVIKKLKTLFCGDVLLMNWPEKKSLEHSLKKIAKNKSKRFQNWKRNQEKRW